MTSNQHEHVLHEERLRGGQMWSRILRRGQRLRITDLEGGAAVAALFYSADDHGERYNMPDTLKAQHIARLTKNYVLYSDMGRVLCSIVEDSCGWHDTITGASNAESSRKKYGEGAYQELRNDFYRNTRDNFLVELGKYGMGKKDIVPNVNLFVKVQADARGQLRWIAGNSRAGSQVTLRAEIDTLVILSNTPHPLDPSPRYAPPPVALSVALGQVLSDADPCIRSRPENERGFALTRDSLL
jgi:uncharacterized protein